jgi:acid phosphatase type 7
MTPTHLQNLSRAAANSISSLIARGRNAAPQARRSDRRGGAAWWSALAILFSIGTLYLGPMRAADVALTRGPYLQSGTASSVVVRWRTDQSSSSVVKYGTGGQLTQQVTDSGLTTEHVVTLTGLTPETRYDYSIGSFTQQLAAGPSFFFVTAPPPGASRPARIWVLGDSGATGPDARMVRDRYKTFTGNIHTDLWLMLGDNAYSNGTDAEYQTSVFYTFQEMARKSVLWPTIGNHDSANKTSPTAFPYLDMFTLPTQGEVGGTPSATEKYYSFDYGNIHFICLDSMTSDRSAFGAMANWLRADLSATSQRWRIAFWHHPPYSKGSHNSDTELQLIQMRENIVPILENYDVDLVLTGHSHSYERSFLLDGHYGTSSTLQSYMIKDRGDGRMNGTGPYRKPGSGPHEGAVYVTAGMSSIIDPTLGLNHPAMFTANTWVGSLVLDIDGDRLDLTFLRLTGEIDDSFTILKGSIVAPVSPGAPTALNATATSTTQINLQWTDNSTNEAGFRIERSPDGVTFTEIAVVGSNVTTYVSAGLTASTTYRYRVRAYNSDGNSAYTNIATTTTHAPSPAPLAPPSNLTATANSGSQVTLAWTYNAGTEVTFKIERARGSSGDFVQIATVGQGARQYIDSGLLRLTTYRYRVRASSTAGDSAYSNTVSVKTRSR